MTDPIKDANPNDGKDGKDNNPPSEFDTSKISDEQFAKVFDDKRTFNHPRFKELLEAKKERDAIKAAKQKEEEDRMIKNKEFEALVKKKDEEIQSIKQENQTIRVNNAIASEALAQGATDTDAVSKLIDKSTIKLNEDGSISGIKEAVQKLLTEKAYLKIKKIKLGNGTNPPDADLGEEEFTMSQIQDPVFYQKNYQKIQLAMRKGKIKEDRPGAK